MRFPWSRRGLPRGSFPGFPAPRRRRRRVVFTAGAALIAILVAVIAPLLSPSTASRSSPRQNQTAQALAQPANQTRPTPAAPSAAGSPTSSAPVATQNTQTIALHGGGQIDDPAQVAAIRTVLAKAETGPPYPYREDGTSFGNHERFLPKKTRGYYREFTVPTSARRDRGPRRLVIGRNGDIWYTTDHYQTYVRLDLPPVIPIPVSER